MPTQSQEVFAYFNGQMNTGEAVRRRKLCATSIVSIAQCSSHRRRTRWRSSAQPNSIELPPWPWLSRRSAPAPGAALALPGTTIN